MKEGILQFETKETQGEGPECPRPHSQDGWFPHRLQEPERSQIIFMLFMPAINEQSLSLSLEIREMSEVVVHVTKRGNSTAKLVCSSSLSAMILLSFVSTYSGLHMSS